ncbi:MAG: glycosyltransferase family 4 protein [Candidatus Nanopelagicales bacterium]
MRVVATLLSYPPARWIGSELMTHQLLRSLAARGHDITVVVRGDEKPPPWEHEGIRVRGRAGAWDGRYDVIVCHPDYASTAREIRRHRGGRIVAVCHNAGIGERVGLSKTDPELVVCNSRLMADTLGERDALVVTPPLRIPAAPVSGDRVTIVNLNENKAGRFWDIAAALPHVPFLAVLGGYGDQIVPSAVPGNVEVAQPVPAPLMAEQVWSRTRVLLAPSAQESWSMTAAEAMAHGVPVIAHPADGLLANLGDAGVFVDRDDVPAWSAAITALHDTSTWQAASERARARAAAHAATADHAAFVAAVEAWEPRHAAAAR